MKPFFSILFLLGLFFHFSQINVFAHSRELNLDQAVALALDNNLNLKKNKIGGNILWTIIYTALKKHSKI